MPGTNIQLKPLAVRKQLLLVESEVNRAQLVNDCVAVRASFDNLSNKARTVIESFHSTMDVVHDRINSMRGAVSSFQKSKSNLLSTLINGFRIGSSIWGAIRSRF